MYEHVFRLADRMLPASTETTADKLRYYRIKCGLLQRDMAEMLKIDDITGTLEPGKFADLLVINGNPAEDMKAISTENMEVIMKEGAFVKGA